MERVVRERMTIQDADTLTPQTLINIRPVIIIKENKTPESILLDAGDFNDFSSILPKFTTRNSC